MNGSDGEPGALTEGLEEILEQSCKLMAAQGYDGTSMRSLARETGRSLSGLYHYFRSKEELLFLINFHGFTRLNDSWDRISDALTEPEERLFAFIYFHLTYFVQHLDEMRVMTWGTRELAPDKARAIQKLKDRYAEQARSILIETADRANGDRLDAKQSERQTYLLFGMMNWIFGWYSPRRHGSLTDLINDVYHNCAAGVHRRGEQGANLDALHARVGPIYGRAMAYGAWDRAERSDGGRQREKR